LVVLVANNHALRRQIEILKKTRAAFCRKKRRKARLEKNTILAQSLFLGDI